MWLVAVLQKKAVVLHTSEERARSTPDQRWYETTFLLKSELLLTSHDAITTSSVVHTCLKMDLGKEF